MDENNHFIHPFLTFSSPPFFVLPSPTYKAYLILKATKKKKKKKKQKQKQPTIHKWHFPLLFLKKKKKKNTAIV